MKKLKQFINRLICKYKGHDFEIFGVYDRNHEICETQGICKRCDFDTHADS